MEEETKKRSKKEEVAEEEEQVGQIIGERKKAKKRRTKELEYATIEGRKYRYEWKAFLIAWKRFRFTISTSHLSIHLV